jgi:hypothetical protein
MSGNVWEGIRNNLTGLGKGVVDTFTSIPDYAYRGMQVWGHNNKLVEDIARNKALTEEGYRNRYQALKPRVPGVELNAPFPKPLTEEELQQAYEGVTPGLPDTAFSSARPEADGWLNAVDENGRLQRRGIYQDNPALYYYDTAAAYAGRYPWQIAGGAVGGYALDQWLNKPVEGLVDTLTFNALNLRPDERTQQSDVFYPAVPTLTAEDLAYQIKRQQGNMAISALTLQQLQRLQQLQNGQSLQQLQPIEYGY